MRSMQVDRWTVARVQLLFTCCSVINLSHYSLRSWLTSLVLQATRLRRDSMALTALAAGKKQQEVATNSYSHQQIPQKKISKKINKAEHLLTPSNLAAQHLILFGIMGPCRVRLCRFLIMLTTKFH